MEQINNNEAFLSEVVPSKEIIDLSVLPRPIDNEIGFRKSIQELCKNETLPPVFPSVADFFKVDNPSFDNRWRGLTINKAEKDRHLTLPKSLLDGDAYQQNPELRGLMEEIILGYEKERKLQGYPTSEVSRTGWSEKFLERLEKVQTPAISYYELNTKNEEEEDENKPPIKGRKIA